MSQLSEAACQRYGPSRSVGHATVSSVATVAYPLLFCSCVINLSSDISGVKPCKCSGIFVVNFFTSFAAMPELTVSFLWRVTASSMGLYAFDYLGFLLFDYVDSA